ncbi:MAG TPA: universal stress protein [Acidimicrobiales bacterium]|nr:universal stress protein [Acidimicrobiales bacterium]
MITHRVVVGTDGSEHARHALRWAAKEAELRLARLSVVLVWTPPGAMSSLGPITAPIDLSEWEQAAKEALEADLADAVATTGIADPDLETEVVRGQPAAVLLDRAAGADLLVVGSRGWGGFKGLLLGSVSQQCATHSDVPVAVVRFQSALPDTRNVVVGVDGSEGSAAALRFAILEAARRSAHLVVANGWWVDSPRSAKDALPFVTIDRHEFRARSVELMEHMVDDASRALGRQVVDVEFAALEESPAHALVRLTDNAGLLVVGSRGRGGLAGLLLGSVSLRCLQQAYCAVVVVPPPEASR